VRQKKKKKGDDLRLSKKELKRFNRGLLAEWLAKKGYYLNTWLIMAGFILPLALLAYQGYEQGFSQKYSVACPDGDVPCKNPFYSCDPTTTSWCPDDNLRTLICTSEPGLCITPVLSPGSFYGDQKSAFEQNYWLLLLGSLLIVYGLNHLIYNSREDRVLRRVEYEKHQRQKAS
jgi:hypothetical protein